MNTVIDTLDDIHDTAQFANLRVEKLVPCPCPECIRAHTRGQEPYFFKYNFLIKKLTRNGNTKVDCEKSTDEVYISAILKQSGVRVFKIDDIKNLIAADKIEEALNLLRGEYNESDEVILLMNRLTNLEKENHGNRLERKDYTVEKARIVESVMAILSQIK